MLVSVRDLEFSTAISIQLNLRPGSVDPRPIRVSSKTLAHISSGLYRSTAGAMKELISNAFDAGATEASITSNPPAFDIFSCTDNGNGISQEEFRQLMDGGIGFSDKRSDDTLRAFDRPIIGRLGIGLLAMTQLSHGFKVVSHHEESRVAFEARVLIRDLLPTAMDTESKYGERPEIGEYSIAQIPFDQSRRGVTIVSSEMRSGLTKRFRESRRTHLPLSFSRFISEVQSLQSISREGPYWDFVVGLALYSPIRYMRQGPVFGKRALPDIKDELESYNFELSIDGMPARKPLLFPTVRGPENNQEYFVRSLEFDKVIEGQRLSFSGYIYAQHGKSITPVEFRGILIRIRNIAIGEYDKTFLDYEIAEGPRFGWLSGEIYVTDGLEDALNVDRDSFNMSHPHYIKFREVLHSELQKIFSELYRGIKRRTERRVDRLIETRKEQYLSDIEELYAHTFSISEVDELESDIHVAVDIDDFTIMISKSADWPKTPDKRQLAEHLLVASELAQTERSSKRRSEKYAELVRRILVNFRRW